MCRALVLCLQAKSSCCWSGVSCLCHDTRLIFYQLPHPLGKGTHGRWGRGMRGCVKEDRKLLAGVNNPGLWRKVKNPMPCWILSVIAEGLCAPPPTRPLPTWQSSVPLMPVIPSVCQRTEVFICQRPPSTLLMDNCCIDIASVHHRWQSECFFGLNQGTFLNSSKVLKQSKATFFINSPITRLFTYRIRYLTALSLEYYIISTI